MSAVRAALTDLEPPAGQFCRAFTFLDFREFAMLIEQSASDQSKIAGQQTQWLAYIDTDTGGDHRPPRPFTWRGFAHSESDAIAKAIKSSELTLRAFDALDHRPSAGAAPTPLAALRIVALPAERSGSNDLSHALSVAGAPFIQPSGAEEQFCLAATRPTFKPDGVDYTITHQITRMTMWLMTLDPLVRRILAHDQKLTVRWTANVDMLRQPDGGEYPSREVGFSVCDQNGLAVAVLCTAVRKPSSGAPAFVPARAA